MTPFIAVFFVLLLITSSYAAGRIHGGLSYRLGYRRGYSDGFGDGHDKGARDQMRNALHVIRERYPNMHLYPVGAGANRNMGRHRSDA